MNDWMCNLHNNVNKNGDKGSKPIFDRAKYEARWKPKRDERGKVVNEPLPKEMDPFNDFPAILMPPKPTQPQNLNPQPAQGTPSPFNNQPAGPARGPQGNQPANFAGQVQPGPQGNQPANFGGQAQPGPQGNQPANFGGQAWAFQPPKPTQPQNLNPQPAQGTPSPFNNRPAGPARGPQASNWNAQRVAAG